jgi:hypothetical protein
MRAEMTQKTSQKSAANYTEEIFDEFVSWSGGELVHTLFNDGDERPLNADYLLSNRTVVGELKCLSEDYFHSRTIEKKSTALLNKWLAEGLIPKECFKDNIINIPQHLTLKFSEIFLPSLKSAIEKANKQIKATKEHFGIKDSKGLLILINEKNSSLTPQLALTLLARILKSQYSSINSFIYLVPTMEVTSPTNTEPSRIWISGPTRNPESGVDSEFMDSLEGHWIKFLEIKYGQSIKVNHCDDHAVVDNLKFTRE